MKAVRIHTLGGPEVLRYEDVPDPQVGAGEVLIKVAAAGVNYADLGRRKGTYARQIALPAILGSEVAGTVAQIGPGVEGFTPGELVMAWAGRGGYAEYVTAPVATVYTIPASLSFEAAAGMPVVFLTAYHLLKTCARVRPGETVLIQAAASGVGTIAVQLAKLVTEAWGGSYDPQEALDALACVIEDKIGHYGPFGEEDVRLIVFYNRAALYNMPFGGVAYRKFEDVAALAAKKLRALRVPFKTVYLLKALEPELEAFEVYPMFRKCS